MALRAGPPSRPRPQGARLGGRRRGGRPRGRGAGRGEGRGAAVDRRPPAATGPPTAPPVWVRVNPPTEAVGRADVDALAGMPVDGLRLPRCEDPAVVHAVAEQTGHALLPVARDRPWPAGAPASWPARIPRSGVWASASRTSPPTSWSRPTRGWTGPAGHVVAASRAAGLASPVQSVWTRRRRPRRPAHLLRGRPGHGVLRAVRGPPVADPGGARGLHPVAGGGGRGPRGARHRRRGPSPRRGRRPRRAGPVRRPGRVEARARVVLDRIPVDRDVDRDPKGQS